MNIRPLRTSADLSSLTFPCVLLFNSPISLRTLAKNLSIKLLMAAVLAGKVPLAHITDFIVESSSSKKNGVVCACTTTHKSHD